MAKNEITIFNPLINPLFITECVGLTKAFFEKTKKVLAYHFVGSKYENKNMPT